MCRFLSPQGLTIEDPADYNNQLIMTRADISQVPALFINAFDLFKDVVPEVAPAFCLLTAGGIYQVNILFGLVRAVRAPCRTRTSRN